MKVARRETTENTDDNLQENEFAHELANATLPSYLKDLYMKFTFPAHAMKDQKNAKANTIRSYENQINGKSASVCMHMYIYCSQLEIILSYSLPFIQMLVVDIINLTLIRPVLMERK